MHYAWSGSFITGRLIAIIDHLNLYNNAKMVCFDVMQQTIMHDLNWGA